MKKINIGPSAAVSGGSLSHTMPLVRVFVVVCVTVLLADTISASPFDNIKVDNFKIKLSDGALRARLDNPSYLTMNNQDLTGETQLPIELGVQLPSRGIDLNNAKNLGANKLGFGEHTTLELKNTEGEERCVEVEWSSTENHPLEDCFVMKPHSWYGGAEQTDQYWPIEQAVFKDYSYVTKETHSMAIAEPYWLNSDGFMIYVDKVVPLFIDQNHHRKDSFCLIAKHAPPYLRKGGPTLKYTMCKFENPRKAHEYAIHKFLGKPTDIPDTTIIEHPIWSTWAKYKININEAVVMEYAKEIRDNGFNNSQLEIDDLWETCYGSLQFNKTTFPNMKRLVDQLRGMGFRTTIWVHPFINLDCEVHKEAQEKGYFVKNIDGNTTTNWWNGVGSYIDATNPAAAEWYRKRLQNVLDTSGIDSFKFDAGESSWVPQIPVLNGPELEQPEIIVQKYVELAAKFGSMVEVRAAKRTQHLPIFVRMIDRESLWGYKHLGLHSVITATFQMNLNGYPFVLPDMVGGNAYNGDKVTKEMFIRYLQTNVFLPAIQFSIPPWDYDKETVQLSKKYTSLHYEYAGTIVALMKKAVQTGQPINTPIWWVDPTNKEAHGINSEYMLGEDILVAPIVEQGAVSRDIYLPKGQWRDEAKADRPVHTGPVWLRNYPAPLDTLPYFTRVSSGAGQISVAILLLVGISSLLTIFR
ncbi:unnamed protein product [Bemisia tabaci]|uniref:Myogenesis-regulating glycosidase-like n=1 Tax=Bemisia tabaci TaxID=7038 RepID=A0A9P0AGJ8_BEMTA|nr:unnamed protein product [Bemisia tabaci]